MWQLCLWKAHGFVFVCVTSDRTAFKMATWPLRPRHDGNLLRWGRVPVCPTIFALHELFLVHFCNRNQRLQCAHVSLSLAFACALSPSLSDIFSHTLLSLSHLLILSSLFHLPPPFPAPAYLTDYKVRAIHVHFLTNSTGQNRVGWAATRSNWINFWAEFSWVGLVK